MSSFIFLSLYRIGESSEKTDIGNDADVILIPDYNNATEESPSDGKNTGKKPGVAGLVHGSRSGCLCVRDVLYVFGIYNFSCIMEVNRTLKCYFGNFTRTVYVQVNTFTMSWYKLGRFVSTLNSVKGLILDFGGTFSQFEYIVCC